MACYMHAMWLCPTYKRDSVEEKIGGMRRKGERKRERKEDPMASSFNFRCSNSQSSSSQELKSVYSTRATLQEVGIFLLWLIAFLFGQVLKGTVWGLFSRLFRTNFNVVRTEQSRLIKGLVSRVLANGVVQFGDVSDRVGGLLYG